MCKLINRCFFITEPNQKVKSVGSPSEYVHIIFELTDKKNSGEVNQSILKKGVN